MEPRQWIDRYRRFDERQAHEKLRQVLSARGSCLYRWGALPGGETDEPWKVLRALLSVESIRDRTFRFLLKNLPPLGVSFASRRVEKAHASDQLGAGVTAFPRPSMRVACVMAPGRFSLDRCRHAAAHARVFVVGFAARQDQSLPERKLLIDGAERIRETFDICSAQENRQLLNRLEKSVRDSELCFRLAPVLLDAWLEVGVGEYDDSISRIVEGVADHLNTTPRSDAAPYMGDCAFRLLVLFDRWQRRECELFNRLYEQHNFSDWLGELKAYSDER